MAVSSGGDGMDAGRRHHDRRDRRDRRDRSSRKAGGGRGIRE